MARMDVRLFGCSAVPPLLAAPAAGRLWGGTRVAARVLRELTRRSCLNGARQRAVSSAAHPATDMPQVCPFASRRGRRLGVAFSLVTFFWRSKRKLLARRATPGLRPQQRHAAQSAHENKYYKINSNHRISHYRIQPQTPQTGPKAIRPDEVTDASLACRVSTRLRPARLAS